MPKLKDAIRTGIGNYDPEIKERARLLYMEYAQPRHIKEALALPIATVYKWIKVGGWGEERDKKKATADKQVSLAVEPNKVNTLLRQHSIYCVIEDLVEKRLLNIVKQLKDKNDVNFLEELSLVDIVKYFPTLFKDSREVFSMKQEYDLVQSKKNEKLYDQKQIMENPRLLSLFMQAREAQEKLMLALQNPEEEVPKSEIFENRIEGSNQN